jgi:CHAD domain-containing protein
MNENSMSFAANGDIVDTETTAIMLQTNGTTDDLPERLHQRVTLADYIYPAIQKQYIAILTHEADVIASGDVEAVHQMRVSLRRLRSIIQAFAQILDIPRVMGDQPIGKIAKTLGKVRDLDVLKDTCKDYQHNLPDSERSYLQEVISKISKRRRKAMFKVEAMLDDKGYQFFKLGLNNWLNNPQYTQTICVPIESILPDLLGSVVGRLFLNPGWWIDIDPDAADTSSAAGSQLLLVHGTVFHTLRKQVKATRYLMELFPDRYSPRYNDYLKDLQQIHKLFGNIQDGVVLDLFLQHILGKRVANKLPTIYAQIDRDRDLNWQTWQPIQDRYQQPETRRELQFLLTQDIIHN